MKSRHKKLAIAAGILAALGVASHLVLNAKIPGIERAKFDEIAAQAKAGCPISRLLNAKVTLAANLA